MTSSTLRPARRLAVTVAMAGAALFAGVVVAPAASAATAATAEDLSDIYLIDGPGARNGNGPISFIIGGENGRKPVFFCDEDKPNERRGVCIPDPTTGPRW